MPPGGRVAVGGTVVSVGAWVGGVVAVGGTAVGFAGTFVAVGGTVALGGTLVFVAGAVVAGMGVLGTQAARIKVNTIKTIGNLRADITVSP
jgi:hypothetical protein